MEKYIQELEAERLEELEAYLLATGLKDYQLTQKEQESLDLFEKIGIGKPTNQPTNQPTGARAKY